MKAKTVDSKTGEQQERSGRKSRSAKGSPEPGASGDGKSTSLTRIRQSTEVINQRGKGVILVISSDSRQAEDLFYALNESDYHCDIAPSGDAALEALQANHYDLFIADAELDGSMTSTEVLQRAREFNPFVGVILLAENPTVESAVDMVVRLGASDVAVKPIKVPELRSKVARALESQQILRRSQESQELVSHQQFSFKGIMGTSEKMRRVYEQCGRVAPTDATVLITGESGTGKEVIAKAIHESSHRRLGRFVAVNCAALSPQLIEAELFGHEKGAFTGATGSRKGYFEHSNGGTIFLDEVGDIPLETQVKLLRVLENQIVTRVGSNESIEIDVRVVSATHRNLEQLVEDGKFREDLYYRLKVVTIHLPPLRERSQDIPPLVDYFLRNYSDAYGKHFTGIEREALAALVAHSWKGNIRELKHAIENVIVIATGPLIRLEDLPENILQARSVKTSTRGSIQDLVGLTIRDVERELIRDTLTRVGGNRQEAARLLGIGERTLYRKIKLYSLS